jgi:hypothetical protein
MSAIVDPQPARRISIFPFAGVGGLAGDIHPLRAIISNGRYDGLIGSCGALEQALGAKAQIVLSPGRHGLSRALP